MNLKYLTFKRLLLLASKGDVSDLVAFYSDLPFIYLRIGFKRYNVPKTLIELQTQITWAQRLYFASEPTDFIDLVFKRFNGWFYPILTGKQFNEQECSKIDYKALNCNVDELLPFVAHMSRLIEQLLIDEAKKTASDVDKTWIAAGGEKLTPFANMLTIDFLADKLRCHPDEVLNKPYADCLVRLMHQKISTDVENEYRELLTLKTTK